MSTNTSLTDREYVREVAFGIGAFLGTMLLAFGLATLVLAMSVGLRRGQEYLPAGAQTALVAGGGFLVVFGALLRLYRDRVTSRFQSTLVPVTTVGILVGIALVLFGAAAETTVSAPFLTSPREKVLLFGIAYGLVAVGLVLLRGAARVVGW